MFTNLRLLSEQDAKVIVEEAILNEFNPTEINVGNYHSIVELLPQLIAAAGHDRRYGLLQTLSRMRWPSKSVVMLSSALAECCQTEEDCYLAITKIVSYAKWTKQTPLFQTVLSNRSVDSLLNTNFDSHIDPEEMPILLYNLIGLSRKCENSDR